MLGSAKPLQFAGTEGAGLGGWEAAKVSVESSLPDSLHVRSTYIVLRE